MNLIYCNKKTSNTGTCSKIAMYTGQTVSRKGNDKTKKVHRCEEHKFCGTVNHKIEHSTLTPLDQNDVINDVNNYLKSFIGKEIFSRHHRNKYPFIGCYLKPNGAIMCKGHNNKWFLVYYNQILNG